MLQSNLILTIKHDNDTGMLLLMNPEAGNYQTIYHPSYQLIEGEKYEFYCPICHSKLGSELNENLVMVILNEEDGKSFELHFSKIAGQRSTYKIMGKEVQTFGIDAPHYLDFINLMDMA
jgi:hypothetical protein